MIRADGAETIRWLLYGELERTARQFDSQAKSFKAYSKIRSDRVQHIGYLLISEL